MKRFLCHLFIVACTSLSAAAQLPAEIRFDNLGIESGLSQSTVGNILQDHEGFMWISTEDGLNRYDGYHFKVFRPEPGNDHSIVNSLVLAVHEDPYHNLWIVSVNGICRYNRAAENFDRLLFSPGIIKWNKRILLFDYRGETIFINDGLLYRLNGKTGKITRQRTRGNSGNNNFLAMMADSTFLMTDQKGLCKYDPGTDTRTSLKAPPGLTFSPEHATFLPGNLLLLFAGSRIAICDGNATAIIKQAQFGNLELLTGAVFDGQGHLWLTSADGLLYVDTASMKFQVFNSHADEPASLAGNMVRCIYRDRGGIIWIGTNEGGISRIIPGKNRFAGMGFRHGDVTGLYAKAVLGFAEDYKGNIWLATSSAGINILNPARRTVERCDKATGCNFHTDTYIVSLVMNDSLAWCAHQNGVDIVSARTRKVVATPLLSIGCGVKKIYRDREGNTWLGGRQGLYLYNPQARKFLPYQLSMPLTYVEDIIEDRKGDMWVCLAPGLIRFNPATGQIKDYGRKFPELIGGNSDMSGLSMDTAGNIWLGSSERGLYRYERADDSFRTWSTANGLPNNLVYTTIADRNNNIWLTTNYGVSMFDPRRGSFTNYSMKDGLQSNEFNGGAIFRDHGGRLYFGNVAGFNSIDPSKIAANTTAPVPRITAFRVFDKEIPFRQMMAQKGGEMVLEQSQNYFSIDYSALDFSAPSENKYRIMLAGFDKGWRAASTGHTVSYTNLDPGHYTFRVVAYNNDGVPAKAVLELPIYIRPPFYRTWWFLSLAFITFISLIVLSVRLRLRNIHRKNTARLQLSNLDKQMTEYKLQALHAQMNPHFIFNSLNAIQSIIMQNDSLKAATYLADFSKLMRRILDNSHEQFVSLETMVETLRMYVHLEAFRFNNEFSYQFRIDDELPMRSLKLPPMLLQPYVENAILHGLMPKEGPKRLLIHLFDGDQNLHCVIEDNGVGRGYDAARAGHISRGEVITKGIRESLNQLLNITATIEYDDLKDATGAPSGTRVTITVPLNSPHNP